MTADGPSMPDGCDADRGSGRASPPSSTNRYSVPAGNPSPDSYVYQPSRLGSGRIASRSPPSSTSTDCSALGAQTSNHGLTVGSTGPPGSGTAAGTSGSF